MNGYFQLCVEQGRTSVMLYPPTDGGEQINPAELLQYLTVKQIVYDAREISQGLQNLTQPVKVCINLDTRYPEQEMFFVRVSPDKMTAVARFYPPSNGGKQMDKAEILRDLNHQLITYGIDETAIEIFLAKREYCKDIIIARGKAPVQGKDASIEYYFNTNPKIRPTLLEDGSVDFFHLNTLNSCAKGDILARLYPAVIGTAGYAINGDVIKPRDVKKATLKFGHNITISEEKTLLTAEVDGHVKLVDDRVIVSDVYEVKNVDNSTGNIEYEGSIKVSGNIMTNFTVKARGNIEIAGVVEGATVEAGGDIIIARGMNGMNRGRLIAGGNVISKFLENATVEAGGYVETESILHSNVMAKTEITVTGRKAFITGGRVCASNLITMKTLGSPMAADTLVEVGADPAIKMEIQKLQKEVAESNKNLRQIQPVLAAANQKIQSGNKLPREQVKYILSLADTSQQLQELVNHNATRIAELTEILDASTNAAVVVTGEVYAGTKISIMDVSMTVRETIQHCRFIKDRGDVRMASI